MPVALAAVALAAEPEHGAGTPVAKPSARHWPQELRTGFDSARSRGSGGRARARGGGSAAATLTPGAKVIKR